MYSTENLVKYLVVAKQNIFTDARTKYFSHKKMIDLLNKTRHFQNLLLKLNSGIKKME